MIRTTSLAAALLCLSLAGSVSAQTTFAEAMKEIATQRATNNNDAAEAAARKAVELAGSNDEKAQAYQQLSLVFTAKRDYPKAIEIIEQGLTIEGLRPTRKYSLVATAGAAYLANGDFEKARETYTSIIDAQDAPNNARVRGTILLASTYSTSNRDQRSPARARELLKSVENLTYATPGEKAEARMSLANLEVAEKNYDEGIAILNGLLEMENITPVNRVRYRITLGNAYRAARNFEQALAAYDLVLGDDNATPAYKATAQQGKAASYHNARDFAKAIEAYEELQKMPGASASQKAAARTNIERLRKEAAQ